MNPRSIVVFGATSGIAHAVSREYALLGARLHLVGRNETRLNTLAQDLMSRGASGVTVHSVVLNLCEFHSEAVAEAKKQLGTINTALVAYGLLGEQDRAEREWGHASEILQTNFMSQASLCLRLADVMSVQKSGVIAVIGSVAGDRGRQSNFVYGSAKAGMHAFLSGLRNRLFRDGVHVLTIKPGFVDTPMTAAFKKGLLWATPEGIAPAICSAIERKKDTIFVPFFWRWIMFIIRSIPESIFKKLKL